MGIEFRGQNLARKAGAETQGKGGEEGKGESTAAWKMKDAGKLILGVFNVNLAAAGVTAAPPPISEASPLGAAPPADSSTKLQYVEGRDDYTVPAGSSITLYVDCNHALAGAGSNHWFIEFLPTGSTEPPKRLEGDYTVAPKDVKVHWQARNTQAGFFYKFRPNGNFGIYCPAAGTGINTSVDDFRANGGNVNNIRILNLRPEDERVLNRLAARRED